MKPTTATTNNHIFAASLAVLRPTKTNLIIYLLFSIFVITSSRFLWFLDYAGISGEYFRFITDAWTSFEQTYDVTTYWNTISNGLLWFALGSVIYLLIWMIVVTVVDGYNDIIISTRFIHPRSFHQSDYWAAIIGRYFVRFSVVGLLIGFIFWSITVFIPYIYATAYELWESSLLEATRDTLVVIAITILLCHTIHTGLRIVLPRREIL